MTEVALDQIEIDFRLCTLKGQSGDARNLLRYFVLKTHEMVATDRIWSDALKRIFATIQDVPDEQIARFAERMAAPGFAKNILTKCLCDPMSLATIPDANGLLDLFESNFPT